MIIVGSSFCCFCPSREFSLIWWRHHCWWRTTIQNYARHSWSLFSATLTMTPVDKVLSGSLGTIEDLWHSHLKSSVWQWNCHYTCFNELGLCYWIWVFENGTDTLPVFTTCVCVAGLERLAMVLSLYLARRGQELNTHPSTCEASTLPAVPPQRLLWR